MVDCNVCNHEIAVVFCAPTRRLAKPNTGNWRRWAIPGPISIIAPIWIIGYILSDPCPDTKSGPAFSALPADLADDPRSAAADDVTPVITRYNRPDRNDSIESDSDRLVIPLRVTEYRPEGVKILFYAIVLAWILSFYKTS